MLECLFFSFIVSPIRATVLNTKTQVNLIFIFYYLLTTMRSPWCSLLFLLWFQGGWGSEITLFSSLLSGHEKNLQFHHLFSTILFLLEHYNTSLVACEQAPSKDRKKIWRAEWMRFNLKNTESKVMRAD